MMKIKEQPKLKFNGVIFPKINFEVVENNDEERGIDISIDPKVRYYKEKKQFEILMVVRLSCEKTFELGIIAIGSFELTDASDDDFKDNPLVKTNAPAIMFPYVRSFISTLTANVGGVIKNLNIPTYLFKGDLEEISPQKKP